MRAIVRERYGSLEDLRLAEIDVPAIGDDDVLVRVHAAGVDRGVWHVVTGLPYLVRIAGFGLRRPKAPVPGADVAGRIEAVGRKVERMRVGDEVYGTCDGAFAEYACTTARRLASKPASVTFEQAAAVPVSALAALQGLRDIGRVRIGHRVLITGAAGGVGTFALQIAKALGAEVTGVCSTGKLDLVRSLGADHVIDYTKHDVEHAGVRHDIILDLAGNRSVSQLRRVLAPAGTLVIVGGDGGRWVGGTDRQLRAIALSPLVRQRLRGLMSKTRGEDLADLTELIDAGAVKPIVDRAYTLAQAPRAIRDLLEGRVRGKAVIAVATR